MGRLTRIGTLALLGACSTAVGEPGVDGGVTRVDAGTTDAGRPDAGIDLGIDAGAQDAGLDLAFDAGEPDVGVDFGVDFGADFGADAGRPRPCVPQDAVNGACGPDCDAPDRWYFGPDGCQPIGCACVGEDCRAGYATREACRAANAICDPVRCRLAGGVWRSELLYCGHFVCGLQPPVDCLVPAPACDCGPGRSFNRPSGACIDEPDCEELRGQPLCEATGGVWTEGLCCPTRCGVRCSAECLAPACACGTFSVWDDALGCRHSRECPSIPRCERSRGDVDCSLGEVCCGGRCETPTCRGGFDERGCRVRE
ncbi:MAG: hypothetical protein AAGH15_04735 [Myxococcota bacterium]